MSVGSGAILAGLAVAILLVTAWLWPERGDAQVGWEGRWTLARFYARVFQLHAGVGTIGAALIAIGCRFWRSGLLVGLAGIAMVLPWAREYVPKEQPAIVGRPLRIMSANLFAYNRDASSIIAAIEDADPDVIVACEVTGWSQRNVFSQLAARYPYESRPDYDGAALVLSRIPFAVDRKVRPSPLRNPLLFQIDGGEIALYPVHLSSPGSTKHLMRNRSQSRLLEFILQSEQRAVVVAGDFNCTLLTPNFRWMTDTGAKTSHQWIGVGMGNTWGPKWHELLNRLPGIRIDHILLSPQLAATSHRVGRDTGSDHRPVIAEIGFRRP